jgi:hypothetical protein
VLPTLVHGNHLEVEQSRRANTLLGIPNFAHLATPMLDGSPESIPAWLGRKRDRILRCTGELLSFRSGWQNWLFSSRWPDALGDVEAATPGFADKGVSGDGEFQRHGPNWGLTLCH